MRLGFIDNETTPTAKKEGAISTRWNEATRPACVTIKFTRGTDPLNNDELEVRRVYDWMHWGRNPSGYY